MSAETKGLAASEERVAPKSPYESGWRNTFGWRKTASHRFIELITYDTRPETLAALPALSRINLSICGIISGYVAALTGPVDFELWEETPGQRNINWYGQMSYGTCWFRGSKIWLTPAAGTTFVVNTCHPAAHPCRQADLRWKERLQPENKYDTMQFPFRTSSPCQLIANMENTYLTLSTNLEPNVIFSSDEQVRINVHGLTEWIPRGTFVPEDHMGHGNYAVHETAWASREVAAWKLWRMMGGRQRACEKSQKNAATDGTNDPLVFVSPTNNPRGDIYEGGVPDVYLIRNREALFEELRWVQEVGEQMHGIRFEWC